MNPIEENDQMYTTLDMGLAAALVTLGYKLEKFTKESRKTAYGERPVSRFHFENSELLKRAIDGYYDNTLSILARGYFDNMKMIKSQIYAEER